MRRIKCYLIFFFTFGVSVFLIVNYLASTRYTNHIYHSPSVESRSSIKIENENIPINIPTMSHDGSQDIRQILEKTRLKINFELYKYNFSVSGTNILEDLVLESGGQPLRALIVSTWRSGTTFLGELLNAIPGTYYHYEPLLMYGIKQIREFSDADLALRTMTDLFKCDYNRLDDYLKFGNKSRNMHPNQFKHNTRLWDYCEYKDLCFDAKFTSQFCKLFPFQTMKVVRIRLRLIREILDDKKLNVKVILLIRDPRGVLQSRRHDEFCHPSPDCWKPSLVCADMISDYYAASQMLKKYPDRLMVLRYEELALKPNKTAHRILKFLKLSPTTSLETFLQSHTNKEEPSVRSTYRISRDVPFKWKYRLAFNYVNEIQRACKEAMLLWGYKLAHNSTHMTSKDFDPMENYTI